MRWLDEPPCTRLDVVEQSANGLVLKGPSAGTRVAGGLTAGFGTVFGGFAAPFLRLPIPMPFKLIPIAFVAVGSGIAGVGAAVMTAETSVRYDRRRGIECGWRVLPRGARHLSIPVAEIENVELSTHQHTTGGTNDFDSRTVLSYRLNVVTKAGRAYALEEFGLRTQAEKREEQVRAILFEPRKKGAPSPRKQRRRHG